MDKDKKIEVNVSGGWGWLGLWLAVIWWTPAYEHGISLGEAVVRHLMK
jgi:hypothetical protein